MANKRGGYRPGSGRKKLDPSKVKKRVTLTLTDREIVYLNYLAEKNGRTRPDVVGHLLKMAYVKKLKKV